MSSAAETPPGHTAEDTVNTVKTDDQVKVQSDAAAINNMNISPTLETAADDVNNPRQQEQDQSDSTGNDNTTSLPDSSHNSCSGFPNSMDPTLVGREEKDNAQVHTRKENVPDSDKTPAPASQDNPETVADEMTATSPTSSEGIQPAGPDQNLASHGDHNDTHLQTARGRRDSSPRVDDSPEDHHHHQQQQEEEVRTDSANVQRRRDSADEGRSYSTEDETSDWETPVDVELEVSHAGLVQRSGKAATWSTIRALTRLMPMAHSLPWSLLAGHQGHFMAGPEGTVLKLRDVCEEKNLIKLREEGGPLYTHYVPHFSGTVKKGGKDYVQMEDLQSGFSSPSIMDVKMGLRTYLVQEMLKAQKESTLRKDLYEKLVSMDPDAPTAEEKSRQKITKTRYLKFRDDMSSSSSLGFRIEGMKTPSIASKDFKKTKSSEDVQKALSAFIGDNTTALEKYISLLQDVQNQQESSQFFRSHEIVGSSLLFVHDSSGKTGVWMIDFAKCSPLPAKVTVDHRSPCQPGSYEDGYWFGLDNLRSIFQQIVASKQKEK